MLGSLITGPLLSFLISFLKRIPGLGDLVTRYPKAIAAVLSAVLTVYNGILGHDLGGTAGDVIHSLINLFATMTVPTFALAVATHEVTAPVKDALGEPSAKPQPPVSPLTGR